MGLAGIQFSGSPKVQGEKNANKYIKETKAAPKASFTEKNGVNLTLVNLS